MKTIGFFLAFIAFTLMAFSQQNITGTFEVDESAANAFIGIEYSSGQLPFEFSGTVGGYTYHLVLRQPLIEFLPNFMRMRAGLDAYTSIGNFHWEITPSIYVNYSASLIDIKAFLENFPTYVNTYLADAPQWLRDVIILHYQNLQLTMYPGKVLDFVESYVPEFLAIEVTNISGTTQSLQGKLSISLTITTRGISPYYEAYTYNQELLKIKSNVRVTVKRIAFINASTKWVYWEWTGSKVIPKGSEAQFSIQCFGKPCNQVTSQSGRMFFVEFESERGTFLRAYTAENMPINNTWIGPLPFSITLD